MTRKNGIYKAIKSLDANEEATETALKQTALIIGLRLRR